MKKLKVLEPFKKLVILPFDLLVQVGQSEVAEILHLLKYARK
jgi:hypothetical protein